ncbi:hypothetical protein RhiXN_01313 [Rhizoctonia solani]|uniref:Uncharacterized protein n=2 Tax=Rhizoctonia solani TaxID=456999 RepID=A0A8H7H2F9_9AGAM|nr:uncharacterized protein RhiXN_01313 [Rhizoctonia solani]KAF8672816.1 hypothetical protein RHS04_07751 [Rhizoctonia solani]QRW26718.1 hypothetical protein RhiXN_01313 [Rhizoctonia solani]
MIFVPSQLASNSAIQWSRGQRPGGPVLLDFSLGWGKGLVFDWYKSIGFTSVTKIQLRKEFEEPFRHEFILIHLQRGGLCRLDRRGDPNVPTNTLRSEGSEAYDTIHEVAGIDEINSTSECLMELCPNGKIDLSFILSICCSIRSDPKTQRYTLQRFNCYFFSWTITSIVARHSVSWDTPAQLVESDLLNSALKQKAIEPIAKKITKMAMKSVSEVFMCSLQPRVRQVLRKHHSPTGFIPIRVLNIILSAWMKRYMRPRMEPVMRNVIESAMMSTMESTVESLLDSRSSVMRTALSHTFWFDSVRDNLRHTARVALRDAIWVLMMKTLKSTNEVDVPVQQHYEFEPTKAPDVSVMENKTNALPEIPTKSTTRKWKVGGILDKILVTGATAITDNSYDTAICSAWGMSDELVGDAQTHEEWMSGWNKLWGSVLQHARSEGQAVIHDVVRTESPDAGRDEIWKIIWEELETGFELSGPTVRDCMWDSFEYTTRTIVDTISDAVFSVLQENPQYSFQAALNLSGVKKAKVTPRWGEISHTEMQGWVKKRIQKHGDKISRLGLGSATTVQTDICEAMGRVWEHLLKHGMDVDAATTH